MRKTKGSVWQEEVLKEGRAEVGEGGDGRGEAN